MSKDGRVRSYILGLDVAASGGECGSGISLKLPLAHARGYESLRLGGRGSLADDGLDLRPAGGQLSTLDEL